MTPLVLLSLLTSAPHYEKEPLSIRLVKTDSARIDILAGERPFTSYHYGLGLAKPIFHPLRSASDTTVTRGYPLELGRPGERRDHWHHESLWFTYGDVNGVDFWAKREEGRNHHASGVIRHTGFLRLDSGTPGYLEASADWIAPDGRVLLRQKTSAVFRAFPGRRTIDLAFELTPPSEAVTFHDTKEGMLGIRVAPALREDQTGEYLNAEGRRNEAGVWGKRSPWVALSGVAEDEALTLVIFNHPKSTGYPTFWHARGYGLFAANPFGRKDFEPGAAAIDYRLEKGETAVFRYRILIHSGHLTGSELQQAFETFVKAS